MAGRPKKVTEFSEDTQEVEVVETVEETEQIEIQEPVDFKESVEEFTNDLVKEFDKAIEESKVEPVVVDYQPKDIVEFYNLRGELRYAPYAYITKRGYKALRKYTKKK